MEGHLQGLDLVAATTSALSLAAVSKPPHLVPHVSVRLSALFLMENKPLVEILTLFSTLLLHSWHFSSARVSINIQRKDMALFSPSTP